MEDQKRPRTGTLAVIRDARKQRREAGGAAGLSLLALQHGCHPGVTPGPRGVSAPGQNSKHSKQRLFAPRCCPRDNGSSHPRAAPGSRRPQRARCPRIITMASRKVRLKIDTADDVVDHREPKPNLNPSSRGTRHPTRCRCRPRGARRARRARAARPRAARKPVRPPPIQKPVLPPPAPECGGRPCRRSRTRCGTSGASSSTRRGRSCGARRRGARDGRELDRAARGDAALPEFTADVASTSVQRRWRRPEPADAPRPVRKAPPNPAAAAPALSASVEAARPTPRDDAALVTAPRPAPRAASRTRGGGRRP